MKRIWIVAAYCGAYALMFCLLSSLRTSAQGTNLQITPALTNPDSLVIPLGCVDPNGKFKPCLVDVDGYPINPKTKAQLDRIERRLDDAVHIDKLPHDCQDAVLSLYPKAQYWSELPAANGKTICVVKESETK